MIRQVRGPGTLVPVQARWLTALTNGRIESIALLPGVEVEPGDIIMVMSNPDEQVQLLQTQQQHSQAQASLTQLRANLETQRLTQEGAVAQVRTLSLDATRIYETNQQLFDANPDNVALAELQRSLEQRDELEVRLQLERDRLAVFENSNQEQIEAQVDQVARLQELVAFPQDRLASLVVLGPQRLDDALKTISDAEQASVANTHVQHRVSNRWNPLLLALLALATSYLFREQLAELITPTWAERVSALVFVAVGGLALRWLTSSGDS